MNHKNVLIMTPIHRTYIDAFKDIDDYIICKMELITERNMNDEDKDFVLNELKKIRDKTYEKAEEALDLAGRTK